MYLGIKKYKNLINSKRSKASTLTVESRFRGSL